MCVCVCLCVCVANNVPLPPSPPPSPPPTSVGGKKKLMRVGPSVLSSTAKQEALPPLLSKVNGTLHVSIT